MTKLIWIYRKTVYKMKDNKALIFIMLGIKVSFTDNMH